MASIAVHYATRKIPHMFEGRVTNYLRRGLEAIHLDPPRLSRRLVDATEVEPCSCTCTLEGGDEGYSVHSMDSDLIDSLGGDPSMCIPKNQSTALISSGNGVCDDLCVTKFITISPEGIGGSVPTGAPSGAPTWATDDDSEMDDDEWLNGNDDLNDGTDDGEDQGDDEELI